jgi:hypothetical protein
MTKLMHPALKEVRAQFRLARREVDRGLRRAAATTTAGTRSI